MKGRVPRMAVTVAAAVAAADGLLSFSMCSSGVSLAGWRAMCNLRFAPCVIWRAGSA